MSTKINALFWLGVAMMVLGLFIASPAIKEGEAERFLYGGLMTLLGSWIPIFIMIRGFHRK